MNVHTIRSGPMGNNTYIVGEKSGSCIVIDPSFGKKEILSFIGKNHQAIEFILLTHGHFDHLISVNDLVARFSCPVYIHSLDKELCFDPILNFSHQYKQPIHIEYEVKEIDDLKDPRFQIIHSPGHSMGSIAIYFPLEKWLFSGDTLFHEGVGRTDMPGASEKELKYSLKNLLKLPSEVVVFPGHDEKTTIHKERLLLR